MISMILYSYMWLVVCFICLFEWDYKMNVNVYLEQSQADEILGISKKFEAGVSVYDIPVWQPHHKAIRSYGVIASDGNTDFGPMVHSIQLKGMSMDEEMKTLTFIHRITRNNICRLDYGRFIQSHSNPDGTIVAGPHLHVYREGFDDKYAIPLSSVFPGFEGDTVELVKVFLDYCHISYEGLDFQGDLYA